MSGGSGGAQSRGAIEGAVVVAVAAAVVLSGVPVGLVSAAAPADPGPSDVRAAGDDARSAASGSVAGAAAAGRTTAAEPNTSGAIDAAVAHVSGYESGDIPDAIVVENETDLVSSVVRTTDATPATLANDTDGLAIEPPRVVNETGAGRVVELYSWTPEQGILLRWAVTVEDGRVVHRSAAAVRVGFGAPAGFEGFFPSEGATVIDESLVEPTAPGGNLSVSNNFVTVYANGTAESTIISVSDFGSGNEQVEINVTIEGTRIDNRSGTPLVISTDANGNGSVRFVPPATLYSGRTCILADSPSTTIQWCITDRTTQQNDNRTMDDERGLLTIEEARNDTATSAGATITYVAKYTDQNLDSVIENDANLTQTESDRQAIVDRVLGALTEINRNQIGNMNFDAYVGQQFDQNRRVPVSINDGTWSFHGVRSTKAFGSLDGSGIHKSMTYNPNIGYWNNATLHTRHIMAHEHFHLIQYSYMFLGNDNRNSWYLEGMARFIETRADPDVVHHEKSLFFADNINGVNGYLDNPDRQSLGNFSYDYAIFWLYLSKRGGINAVERALAEINNVSGSGGIDTWGPKALDRAIRRDANLQSQGIDSYREFLLEFHVDVYRATHGENPLPFVTNTGWAEHMDPVDTEDYRELHLPSDPADSTIDSVGTWGVDYVEYGAENSRSHDGLYLSLNRSDLYTRTVRIGPNSDSPNLFPDSDVARGNLTAGPGDPHLPAPNNTVYHGSMHDDVGVVVASLGRGKRAYNLTGRANLTAHRLDNALNEQGEVAIYLVPVNQPRPGSLGGQYGANGDIFVSVHPSTIPTRGRTGGPRNLTADLTLAAGGSSPATVRELSTSERSDKTELVAGIDGSESSVWKLTVTERSTTPVDPGRFFVRSNYLDGGPSDSLPADQLFGMPTETGLLPDDLQAGSTVNPDQISFVVEVDNGDDRYRHSPFERPDPTHFLVEIGGTPIPPSLMSVATLGQGKYRVTLTPPSGQFSPGSHRLCVAFTETKFGVTETTPDNCGEQVFFPINPPGEGTSIILDPPIIEFFDPTPVLKTVVATSDDNDTVSVVHVDGDGEGSTTAITTTRVGGGDSRSSLKTSIEETTATLDPAAEEFDIAAGLQASLNRLIEADDDAPRAAVLVSPGHASSPVDDAVEAYRDAGIPVHVVAVGDDPNTELLRGIADRTGGTYQRPTSAAEFEAAFGQIDRFNGREEAVERDAFGFGGPDAVTRSFHVDATAGPLVVRVGLNGGIADNATVSLFNPDGEEVAAATATNAGTPRFDVTESRHGGTVVFRLENPLTGNWTYEVASERAVEGDVAASVTSHSTTSLRAATDAGSPIVRAWPKEYLPRAWPKEYLPGETVRIGASLVGPDGGIDDARVTGVLTLPDGERRTVEFEHGGNGSYGTSLAMTEELTGEVLGEYTLAVTAEQGDVVREGTLAWRVRSPPTVPTAGIGDANIAPGESATVDLALDRTPDGLREFDGTVCVSGDTGDGAVAGVESTLNLTVLDRTDRCVTLRVADDAGAVGAGNGSVTLATLTLSETVPGTATLEFGEPAPVIVDDDGGETAVGTDPGDFSVVPEETGTVQLVLDGAPDGLYRYNVTVDATGDLGPIVAVGSPGRAGWLDDSVAAGGVGERSVRLSAIDFENETGPVEGPLVLAELTYATGGSTGNLTDGLGLSVHALRNDNGSIGGSGEPDGDPIDPERLTLRVPSCSPLASGLGFPTDPDGDGLHEDLNANGRADFDDVVTLFEHLESAGTECQDFNRNGRIDYDDLVALFEGL